MISIVRVEKMVFRAREINNLSKDVVPRMWIPQDVPGLFRKFESLVCPICIACELS